MQPGTESTEESGALADGDSLARLLRGYRFSLCETTEAVAQALDVRRRVYVDERGYDVPVPDKHDQRSWFLVAEHLETEEAVGSMRLTPRFAGPFEADEYFRLPAHVRSPHAVELNRFAIPRSYCKGKTLLPIVSLGLFKLVMEYLRHIDAHRMLIASKPESVCTYQWMGFERTGLTAPYGGFDHSEHELLTYELHRSPKALSDHPLHDFFVRMRYQEVRLPRHIPELSIAVPLARDALRVRRSV